MEIIINIVISIFGILGILSILSAVVLFFIKRIYLISRTLKNRNFDDKRLVNKINEFMNAIFIDPDFDNYPRRKHRVNFITKEEHQLNDKLYKYMYISLTIFVVSIFSALLIAAIFGKVTSK